MNLAGDVLLDTSVVVDHLRGDSRIAQALNRTSTVYLSTVVVGELHFGVLRSLEQERQLARVTAFIRTVAVLDVDEQTGEHYGRIKARLAEAGEMIPDNDIWIAATAYQHGLAVATRDRHFARLTELQVLFW